ncbi:MAG: lipopolysaccharide biosynthesis protein [Flavobacteriia bacterium]|nr:lipopolysaccharide biosynthesis protein [Flavobacteriia bacterium]
MSDTLKKKATSAFLWDFLGLVANQGTTFIVSIFLARLLDPKDFGVLGMMTILVSTFQSLTYLGFGESIIQKKESTELQLSTMFYLNILIGIVLCSITFFFSETIAGFYAESQIILPLKALSLCFIFLSVNLIQKALLTKKLAFKSITKASIYSGIISGIVGIVLAFSGYGLWSLVVKTILNMFLNSVLIWWYSNWKPKLLFSLNSIKEHWAFGKNMYLSTIIYTIFNQIDGFFIAKMAGSLQLGLYFRAKSLNQLLVKYSSESLGKIMLPVFSTVQDDKVRLKEIMSKTLHVTSFFVFGLVAYLYLEGEDIIVLLFGVKWLSTITFFNIMIFYSYSYPINHIFGNLIQSIGESAAYLRLEIIKKSMVLIAILIGVYYGIFAFLWSMFFITILQMWINMLYVQIKLKFEMKHYVVLIFKYLIISCLPIFLLFYLKEYLHWRRIHECLLFTFLFVFLYLSLSRLFKSEGLIFIKNLINERFIRKKV